MKTETLTIRYESRTLRETHAWFVSGVRAEDWLQEIVAWKIAHTSVSLRVIPRSRNDRSPVGVLVTVDGPLPVNVSARCRPYGRVGQRFFLPAEARLEPAVHEHELLALLPSDVDYVWHPVSGLVAFEPDDVLKIADLLLPLQTSVADWDRAHPGEAYSSRLLSIEVDNPPSAEEILQEWREDIGCQSQALDELPPTPGESQPGSGALSGLAGMLGVPLQAIARLAKWMASRANAGADRETWVDRLQNWAARVLTPEQQSARDRELDRLLNMLDEDPDRGLKYALPMNGDPARGSAPPSTRLSQRDVDFRLASGSGPADPWDIDLERQQKLIARYRALAEREIRLGRHRRAAYIYAELLGEFASAAAALKSGGHFREAAVLYEERLHRPREAAQCLEEGGLWDEAIERYEQLRDFEKVGQLHRKLEQHDAADESYRNAVREHLKQRNLLKAATLLETELRDHESALSVLKSGWPDTGQSRQCLHEEIRLLSRLGRHEDARKRVVELRDQRLTPTSINQATQVLVETVGESPDAGVRSQAADTTRVMVARRLVETSRTGRSPELSLLTAVENLEPQDRLLHRDCQRFLQDGKQPLRPRPQPKSAGRPVECELLASVNLFSGVKWETAAASSQACYAAGYGHDQLIVSRIGWDNRAADAMVRWRSPVLTGKPILLAPAPNDNQTCWVDTVNGTPLPQRTLGEDVVTHVASPPWTDQRTVALAQSRSGVSWMLSYNNGFVMKAFSAGGTPILSRQIPLEMTSDLLLEGLDAGFETVPFHARSEGAYFAALDRLICVDAAENVTVIQHDQPIKHLCGSASFTRVRIAVSYDVGGAVCWRDSGVIRHFGSELYDPLTTFTAAGLLVAVDASYIEFYRTDRDEVALVGSVPSQGLPIAVMPVRKHDFAILGQNNVLSTYSLKDLSTLHI